MLLRYIIQIKTFIILSCDAFLMFQDARLLPKHSTRAQQCLDVVFTRMLRNKPVIANLNQRNSQEMNFKTTRLDFIN